MGLRPPLRCDEGERLAIIEIQVFERTSTKSDQRNFAFLGFSEVQLATIRRQGCCVPS
jgi:hypothetical protein